MNILQIRINGQVLTLDDRGVFSGSKPEADLANALKQQMPTHYQAGLAAPWRYANYIADFTGGAVLTPYPKIVIPDGATP